MVQYLKKGMLVQLWSGSTNYGVITKINRVTFQVSTGLRCKQLYRIDTLRNYTDGIPGHCGRNIYTCTVIPPDRRTPEFWAYINSHGIYKGKWCDSIKTDFNKLNP